MERGVAFYRAKSHDTLLKLSRKPYDLCRAGALEGSRLDAVCAGKHFDLHYWAQRVDETVISALQELADQCGLVDQFMAMKQGAVMNRIDGYQSENRQVLHTACRDIFSGSPHEPVATEQAAVELEKLKLFLHQLEEGDLSGEDGSLFDTLIHVGIGGSDLGPRSVYEALKPYGKKGRKVYFISNVDPDDAAAVLGQCNLASCLVSIVSKSGSTLETLTNETLVRKAFVAEGLDPARHFLCVTGKGSPMDDPRRYLRTFHMFDYVGGRYSTTSMVGLVTLGFFLGYDHVVDILRGAYSADKDSEQRSVRENPALLLALLGIWNRNYLRCPTLAVLPYSQALHRFAAHLQQCDMESNGKSVDRNGVPVEHMTGPIVWGEPGTNGQHAFFQLLHQGTEIVPAEFIGFRNAQYGVDAEVEGTTSQQKLFANMLAQIVAFATGKGSENPNKFFAGNRPSSLLVGDRLTPETMGALLALYEAKIVFQGFAWNINSFDQEGVQLGKDLAGRFLELLRGEGAAEKGLHHDILKITGGA